MVTFEEILDMTVFNENNLHAIHSVLKDHSYAQLIAKAELKGLHETGKLDQKAWKKFQPFISDRRWIHSLKLGLLTEDEFVHGARDKDNEIEPTHVAFEPEKKMQEEPEEYYPEPDVQIEISEPEEIISEEIFPEEIVMEVEELEAAEIIDNPQEEILMETVEEPTEIQEEELADDTAAMDQDDVKTAAEEESEEDEIIGDVAEEVLVEEKEEEDDDKNQENSPEEVSPFVGWLKSLPTVAGYEMVSAAKKKDKKKKDKSNKKDKSQKKKDKKKGKKKDKKEKKKKLGKKKVKSKDKNPPYQDRLVNSLLLDDAISSEPLANLLKEHGHLKLAREMYERLKVKNPEKSSYFAAQIEQLKEE